MNVHNWNGGIILNIDINTVTTPFLNEAAEKETFEEKSLWPFVDQYADTQIKTLVFDVFCQYSATPSKIWTDSIALHDRRRENGVEVRYDLYHYKGIYQWYVHGIDPYDVWFRRCRQRNMEAWLSVRMNDCHCPNDLTCFLRSDFFYEAREKGWMTGDKYGYYRYCFDYAVPEVRQRMLDYIEEQLDRYDVEGLELDFMREVICFDYLNCPDKVEIMNGFMREVNRITSAAGKKWGHKIKRIVRLPREIDQCLIYGFDPETWVREGLVEHINVTPRWESCDNDMPVALWKEKMPSAEISAGVETLCLRNDSGLTHADADVVNGLAAAYISQGADAVYLYNYFMNPYCESNPCNTSVAEYNRAYHNRTEDIIRRCGRGETVFSTKRRHIIMFQDIAPYGCDRFMPLPMKIEAGQRRELSLPVGYVSGNAQAKLILGFSTGSPQAARICINGNECLNWNICYVSALKSDYTPTDSGYVESHVKLYGCDINADTKDRYCISLEPTESVVLEYVEVQIC